MCEVEREKDMRIHKMIYKKQTQAISSSARAVARTKTIYVNRFLYIHVNNVINYNVNNVNNVNKLYMIICKF